jgi:hypothetical protein
MVVSGEPLRFIPKQTNYMLIFVAPLAMLGGYFLSRLGKKVSWAIVGMYIFGGVALSAFEQQVIHAFTANSKATFAFAQANQDRNLWLDQCRSHGALCKAVCRECHAVRHISSVDARTAGSSGIQHNDPVRITVIVPER